MMPPTARPSFTRDGALIVVPVLLLLAGIMVRYVAYLSINPLGSPPGFVDAMCVWDCYWYGDVASHGYQAYPETLNFGGPAGIANWAFFPLYPLLIAAIGKLGTVGPTMAGTVLSPLLTLGATVCSWPLFDGNRRAHFLLSALLLCGPFSFYFAVPYSESLFLLLTVLGLVALRRGNFLAAGLVGGLLSATRTVGVLFVFAVVVEIFLTLRAAGVTPRDMRREMLRRPVMVLAILTVPLGIFAFMGWLYLVVGDALAFAHIQRAWDRELVNPVTALWGALTSSGGQTRDSLLLGLASIAGLLLCGVLFLRREFSAAVFSTLCLLLALTNGVESMLRFVVALAPLNIALCRLLARWPWLFWVSALSFAALDFEWTIGWLRQQGALM
jgi:hypothetical protein